jgi:hypothetical protein
MTGGPIVSTCLNLSHFKTLNPHPPNITCPFRPRNLLPAPAQVEHRPQQRRRAEVATPARRHLQHAPPVRDIVERAREARVKDPALADAVLCVARLRDDVGDEELWGALDAEQGRRVLRVAWWVPASATRQATILSAPCGGREPFPFRLSRSHSRAVEREGAGVASVSLQPELCRVAHPDLHVVTFGFKAVDLDRRARA